MGCLETIKTQDLALIWQEIQNIKALANGQTFNDPYQIPLAPEKTVEPEPEPPDLPGDCLPADTCPVPIPGGDASEETEQDTWGPFAKVAAGRPEPDPFACWNDP
jgi:hypothetical protein